MKTLIADADHVLVTMLAYVLGRHGHDVSTASDGVQALHRWRTEQPELALLDAALPLMDGLALCRQIRQRSSALVILFGQRGDEHEYVQCYEAGADDCIVKPFSVRRLLLRIESLLRRMNGLPMADGETGHGRLALGDLVIDPGAFEVFKNHSRLRLTRLEFRILYRLARSAGTLVEAQQLADYAWQSATGGDIRLLKTHISHMRQKLEAAGGMPVYIRAIPRTGYILTAPATLTPAGHGHAGRWAQTEARPEGNLHATAPPTTGDTIELSPAEPWL
jgi:DNA-binding response OmpR family regulator